ncbi:MAG: phosphatidate cytidylyltransferase [Phycisphaerae bacterium]|jgi:phosphatidate cytidylyltransferase
MLKYRLIFGTLMTAFFTAVLLLDGRLVFYTCPELQCNPTHATLLCGLIALLIIPAVMEMSRLAAAKGLTIFKPLAVIFSIALATAWYWPQFLIITADKYLAAVIILAMFALLARQYFRFGTNNILSNCGANLLALVYLGLLPAFFVLIDIENGTAALLMVIAVVKCTDIGAYTAGTLWGKHKFSPVISPKKTWEGMAGGIVLATIVSILFAVIFDIMSWFSAVAFAVVLAFIGQLGDLAESLLKRDSEQKDASKVVPGFGGLLDVLDSPLAAAPFAYFFLMLFSR